MKKYLIILCFYSFPSLLYAQGKWSLKDCITYGLENHKSRNVYANEQLVAQAKAKEALAGYLPSTNVNASVDDNLKVQQSIIPAGVFGPTDTKIAFTKKFNATGSVQLDQTIYDQSLLTGLKANKFNQQQAELNTLQNDEKIIYNITTAYYQIGVYREQLRLLKYNRDNYLQQLKLSELQVRKGVATEVDLNKIRVSYNNNNSELVVAESNLTLAENQLKNAMGRQLSAELSIDTLNTGILQGKVKIDASDTLFAVINKTEYRISQVNASLLAIDVKRIRNEVIPKLSFYARYGANGFGDNLSQTFNPILDFSAVGIKLSIPVFDGFKRGAQHTQAKYKYINALENMKIDQDNYQLEALNAKTKLIKAQTNVENDERNVQLAISVFKSTDLQYQKGVTGLTDWLNSLRSLEESQNNYLNSLYNFYLAKADQEKANGTLKTFYTSL